jgi:hypothetical protein
MSILPEVGKDYVRVDPGLEIFEEIFDGLPAEGKETVPEGPDFQVPTG